MKRFINILTVMTATALTAADAPKPKTELATIGGGCFWCVESQYQLVPGVKQVTSGYAGGKTDNPNYEQICTGESGHAEVVQIEFDPATVSFRDLLELFWDAHDPTSVTTEEMFKHGKLLPKGTPYQGNDYGTQYRSTIMYHSDEQKKIAEESKALAQKKFKKPIATEIVPLKKFWVAEDYHQDFSENNPTQGYVQGVVIPKVEKFKHTLEEKGKTPQKK